MTPHFYVLKNNNNQYFGPKGRLVSHVTDAVPCEDIETALYYAEYPNNTTWKIIQCDIYEKDITNDILVPGESK